jgi:fumarylacetoacetase
LLVGFSQRNASVTQDRLDLDRTHDGAARSWLGSANAPDADFPVQNLPFGIFRRSSAEAFRAGVAIGDRILDLTAPAARAALHRASPAALNAAAEQNLNALAALEPDVLTALRGEIFDLLSTESRRSEIEPALVPMAGVQYAVPFAIGDFTDFYASIFHATRVGTMYRPTNPLMPNYKYVPVAYHGRSSTIVVDGTEVRRPRGQLKLSEDAPPVFDVCRRLDYEAEVGFYIGRPTHGEVGIDVAPEHVFGFTVLNDWSARDIQTWEYQPLGPFLGKNFATTVSPWVVTMDALRPFRTHALVRADGDPAALPHLSSAHDTEHGGVAISIEVAIRSERMRNEGMPPFQLSRSSFADSYWTFSQMLAHHASNGCVLRSGDLMGSGTMSGPGDNPTMWGSLVELSHNGRDPLNLPTGETRTFIADGDEILMHARCELPGFASIGFGVAGGLVAGEVLS